MQGEESVQEKSTVYERRERVTSTMKKEREISCRVIISVIAPKRKGKRGESIDGLFNSLDLSHSRLTREYEE